MIEAPPPAIWLPPKPALIRAWKREDLRARPASFLPGMFPAGVAAPTSSFPIRHTSASSTTTSSGTHVQSLPSGIVTGDLILAIMGFSANNNQSVTSVPSGFVELWDTNDVTGDLRKFMGYYKIADGTEGASATWGSTGSPRWAGVTTRISNYTGTPEYGAWAVGSGTSADPPTLSPSWGAKKTLWIACLTAFTSNTPTGYPTNYTDPIEDATASAPNAMACAVSYAYEGATQDPDAFTISSVNWGAQTVAIRGKG